MSALTASYKYRTLPEGQSFRIFQLFPAEDLSDPLRGTLTSCELSAADDKYDAISYVCGVSKPNVQVEIVNKVASKGSSLLLITEHLASALRYMRRKTKRLNLWIDAICIDQDSPLEKAHQVAMLRHIYPKARRIRAWLGVGNSDIAEAFRSFKDIATNRYYDPIYGMVSPRDVSGEGSGAAEAFNAFRAPNSRYNSTMDMLLRPLHGDSYMNDEMIQNLLKRHPSSDIFGPVMNNSWFTRRWVMQEAILARDLTIHCGELTLEIDMFHKAVDVMLRLTGDLPSNQWHGTWSDCQVWMRVQDVLRKRLEYHQHRYSFSGTGKREWSESPNDILRVLWTFEESEVNDPRDLIYSLLGVAEEIPGFEINYTEKVGETMTRLSRALLFHNKDLRVLHHVRKRRSMTYVPDWRQRRGLHTVLGSSPSFTTGLTAPVEIKQSEAGHPIISGYCIDSIIALEEGPPVFEGRFPAMGMEAGFIHLALSRLISQRLPEDCPSADSYLQAFAATLICGHSFPPQGKVLQEALSDAECEAILNRVLDRVIPCELIHAKLSQALPTLDAEARMYLGVTGTLIRNRSFFVTKQGYLGLAPRHAKVEDLMIIIPGLKTPYIVRAADEDTNTHHMLDSIMDMFGPPSSIVRRANATDNKDEGSSDAAHVESESPFWGRYMAIGECYVHGLMDGKLLDLAKRKKTNFELV